MLSRAILSLIFKNSDTKWDKNKHNRFIFFKNRGGGGAVQLCPLWIRHCTMIRAYKMVNYLFLWEAAWCHTPTNCQINNNNNNRQSTMATHVMILRGLIAKHYILNTPRNIQASNVGTVMWPSYSRLNPNSQIKLSCGLSSSVFRIHGALASNKTRDSLYVEKTSFIRESVR